MSLKVEASAQDSQLPQSELRPPVLLVDDNPGKLLSLETTLSELDIELITATSAREALKHLLHNDFAVILLDVSMPEMDGFELAAMIRQRPRLEFTPIIFVTGISTSDAERARGYGMGAVDYMFLPIIPEVFRAKVSALVELYKKSKQVERQAQQLTDLNRQLEAQLDRIELLNHQLAISNRELEGFTYSVSHDLRGPLRTSANFCGQLRAECGESLSGKGQKYMDFIESGLERAEVMIQGFLNLTRVSQNPMRLQSVDLAALVRGLIPELPGHDRVKWVVPDQLVAEADAELISMALNNLIANSIKFTAKVEQPVIELGQTHSPQGQAVYFVRDNGVGFPPEYAERIFAPAARSQEPEEPSGLGTGLATIQRVVHRHGGSIWAEGASEAGATFFFTLARKQEATQN